MAPDHPKAKCIGILTAGGDCPGLNAAIRGITKAAIQDFGIKVVGIEDINTAYFTASKRTDSCSESGLASAGSGARR